MQIIILAAGKGSRMSSSLPKVMHEVGNRPMIERVLLNAAEVTNDIILVHSDELSKYLKPYHAICKFALQSEALGTAHAVYSALELIDPDKINIVIFGDNPFISSKIIHSLTNHLKLTDSAITTLAFKRENPGYYGRIITDNSGNFSKIVEFKNATKEERQVQLCNSGIMAFKPGILEKYLPYCLRAKTSNEFYLTNIIEICKNNGEKISYLLSSDQNAVIGINTREELQEANNILQNND